MSEENQNQEATNDENDKVKRFFPFTDVYEASDKMMNFEMEKARELLDETRSYCPMSQLLYGETFNITSMATQNRKDKEVVISLVGEAEKMAIDYSKSDKHLFGYLKKRCKVTTISKSELINWKAYMKIIQADALLSRSINQLQLNQYLRAAWNLKNCWSMYDGLLKSNLDKQGNSTLHPEIQEHLKFGVGLFYYIISLVPGLMLKVLELIGFVGDSDKAIEYLTEIYQSNGLKAPYASIILMAVYLFLPSAMSDVEKSLKSVKPIIDHARDVYPNGAMFNYLSAQYERKLGNGIDATKYLELAIDACVKIKVEPNLFKWDLANCYLMCLDWKTAIKQLELILNSNQKSFEFLSICALQLSCAYELEGESKKAIETLKTIKNYVGNKGRYDKMVSRKSETILASSNPSAGLISTAFELLYFKRDIAHMMEEHLKQVQKTMESVTASFDPQKDLPTMKKESLPNIAGSLVIEGAVWNGLKDKEKAISCFEKTITMEKKIPDVGRHWIVSALYELGEIYFRNGDLEKANEFITRASNYSNYDWEDVYKSRLSKARSQIKKALEKAKKEQSK